MGAIKDKDVDATRVLLNRGADPNFQASSKYESRSLFEQNNVEIGKLLVEFGCKLDEGSIRYIFVHTDTNFVKEIVPCILKYNANDDELVRLIFCELFQTNFKINPSEEMKIFKLLLEHGLPVDDYLLDDDGVTRTFTTLHQSVQKFNFVSIQSFKIIYIHSYL